LSKPSDAVLHVLLDAQLNAAAIHRRELTAVRAALLARCSKSPASAPNVEVQSPRPPVVVAAREALEVTIAPDLRFHVGCSGKRRRAESLLRWRITA
jgi:hypothetical protein